MVARRPTRAVIANYRDNMRVEIEPPGNFTRDVESTAVARARIPDGSGADSRWLRTVRGYYGKGKAPPPAAPVVTKG